MSSIWCYFIRFFPIRRVIFSLAHILLILDVKTVVIFVNYIWLVSLDRGFMVFRVELPVRNTLIPVPYSGVPGFLVVAPKQIAPQYSIGCELYVCRANRNKQHQFTVALLYHTNFLSSRCDNETL